VSCSAVWPCKDQGFVITAVFALVFLVFLSVPHIISVVWVEGEHVVMLGGLVHLKANVDQSVVFWCPIVPAEEFPVLFHTFHF
jgi:hypothetical protein